MEARGGVEPPIGGLQPPAFPFDHRAVEPMTGVEPVSSRWQRDASPLWLHRHRADGGTRTRFSRVEAWHLTCLASPAKQRPSGTRTPPRTRLRDSPSIHLATAYSLAPCRPVTSFRSPERGSNPPSPPYQGGESPLIHPGQAPPHTHVEEGVEPSRRLLDTEGIEPSSPACKAGVFPLDHAPVSR